MRPEARVLAEEEFVRFADTAASLAPDEWTMPTDCIGWDVRKMTLHVLGSGDAQASVRELVHQLRRGMPLNKEIDLVGVRGRGTPGRMSGRAERSADQKRSRAGPRERAMMEAMGAQDLVQLARRIDARCRLDGTFTLRSGETSDVYFDKYRFEADPILLRSIVDEMATLIPERTEMLGGLELGGIPLATMLSSVTGLPTIFIRKAAKTYGTRRLAEGADPQGQVVLLVEDVITSGGAVRNAATELRGLGATVTDVVCAIDRSDADEEPLRSDGITVNAVLTRELLDSVSDH
jgi:orotate phosphoribosyltransferase